MSSIKNPAIVLRAHRYSESSLVATLLSPSRGRLDVLAKGCRRDKSPLFGHLDLYQLEDVLVLERPSAGLDLLIEAAFIDEHAGLRFSPPAFAAAGLLADLAAETCQNRDPQPELFGVLAGALGLLSRLGDAAAKAGLAAPLPFSAGDRRILVGRTLKLALLDMLGWLGFGLELRRCAVCGKDGESGAALSRRHGGLVCRSCKSKARDAVAISAAALAALRDRGDGAERRELELPEGERTRWLRFLVDYGQYIIDKPLRGRKVLFQLL